MTYPFDSNEIMMEKARGNNWTEVFRLIRQGRAFVNYRDEQGWSPLVVAVAYIRDYGTEKIVSDLLNLFADADIVLDCGQTLLMEARTGSVAERLLQHGVNPYARNDDGYSVLDWYLKKSRLDAAMVLRQMSEQPCISRKHAKQFLSGGLYKHFELGTGVWLTVKDKSKLNKTYAPTTRELAINEILRRLCPWLNEKKHSSSKPLPKITPKELRRFLA